MAVVVTKCEICVGLMSYTTDSDTEGDTCRQEHRHELVQVRTGTRMNRCGHRHIQYEYSQVCTHGVFMDLYGHRQVYTWRGMCTHGIKCIYVNTSRSVYEQGSP